jgi:hypothetical protein
MTSPSSISWTSFAIAEWHKAYVSSQRHNGSSTGAMGWQGVVPVFCGAFDGVPHMLQLLGSGLCQKRRSPAEVAAWANVPMETPIIALASRLVCSKCGLPAGYFHGHNPEVAPHQ